MFWNIHLPSQSELQTCLLDLFHVNLDLDKQYKDFETRNIVENYQTNNIRLFKIPEGKNTQQYKNSFFFVRTVDAFNFKARLKRNFI